MHALLTDKNLFIALGALGVLLYILWVWKSRQGRWLRWSDPFALFFLAAWLIPCFGFFHYELGYLGQVTDLCGNPVAYAYVSPKGAKAPKFPKTFDGPVPAGTYRTDAMGLYTVPSHFRWTKAFTETPFVRPQIVDMRVDAPGYLGVKILGEPKRNLTSLKIKVIRAKRNKSDAYYPNEKAGLSELQEEQLSDAAQKLYWQFRKDKKLYASEDDPRWCEFMAVWTELLNQAGPKALCKSINKLGDRSPLGPDVTELCN